MKYKAYFTYWVFEGDEQKLIRNNVPVNFFQVDGGAKRFIQISSTEDVSVIAELSEVTTLKNIILYLPPTKDGNDMETALELTNVALDKKLSLFAMLRIEKYSGGRMIEAFLMTTTGATLKQRPYVVGAQMLRVDLNLPAPELHRGKQSIKDKNMFDLKPM